MNPALWMSIAGLALLVIGVLVARKDLARARGLDRIVALTNTCFAVPLAVFGAEHFSLGSSMIGLVPPYMPVRLFWIYFVGVALIVAALSIATKIRVRWSGLLFGIMMLLFVLMIHLPGAIKTGDRIIWTIVIREMSFGAGGCVLAGIALDQSREKGKTLITIGRVIIGVAAIFFGIQHLLHPFGVPGVPLGKEMPSWIPARYVIDYLTGAFLIVGGVFFLLGRKTRLAATYLGTWILLLVIAYYGPMLIGSLANPNPGTKLEGLNYFADTLLFGATILTLARTSNQLQDYLQLKFSAERSVRPDVA
jgi:uncharacterized membrane protein YphA (DoxX/SURF4 family)